MTVPNAAIIRFASQVLFTGRDSTVDRRVWFMPRVRVPRWPDVLACPMASESLYEDYECARHRLRYRFDLCLRARR